MARRGDLVRRAGAAGHGAAGIADGAVPAGRGVGRQPRLAATRDLAARASRARTADPALARPRCGAAPGEVAGIDDDGGQRRDPRAVGRAAVAEDRGPVRDGQRGRLALAAARNMRTCE